MAYKYESTSFVVPAGYKKDLGAFVKQVASWISSTFPELTLDRYSQESASYYAYFNLGDTGIHLRIGFYNSGSQFMGACYGDLRESSFGASIEDGSTVSLQLMVVPKVAMLCTIKSSTDIHFYNSSALAVKEIVSGSSYVLCILPGKLSDSSAGKSHFWFPSTYYYKNESDNTVSANVSVFPEGIGSLAGVISKKENDGNRSAVISPVFYMKSGPLSLLTAAEDAAKLMYANDGGMLTVTNHVPIQVGNDQYVALEGSNAGTVYLKVN